MIESFACKETEKIWKRQFSKKLPGDIQGIARRKLQMLHAAVTLDDLRILPENRLEKLSGDRDGQHSIKNKSAMACMLSICRWCGVQGSNRRLSLRGKCMANLIPLEHPGVILLEEFMEPFELSAYKVAKDIDIQQTALSEILKGKRGISPIVGLKLAKYFGLSDSYFINLQTQYTLDKVKDQDSDALNKVVPFFPKSKRLSGDEDLLEA